MAARTRLILHRSGSMNDESLCRNRSASTMTTPVQSYIICCTPRSGSTLLAAGLSATNRAGYPHERFPPQTGLEATAINLDRWITQLPEGIAYDIEADFRYIQNILESDSTDNGVFGVKIHWFQFSDAAKRLEHYLKYRDLSHSGTLDAALPKLQYIWLRRNDKIDQAISWFKAIMTNRWHQPSGASGEANQSKLPTPLEYNFERIRTYLSALRSQDNAWKYYFRSNNIEPLIVDYDELTSNYAGSIKCVLEFLGLLDDSLVTGAPLLSKLADETSIDFRRRFDADRNRLR